MYTPFDIAFWSNRYQDHMNFLILLLDPKLAPGYTEQALSIKKEWSALTPSSDARVVLPLLERTIELKQTLIGMAYVKQINKVITRDNFMDLLDHMIMETLFERSILTSDVSFEEEVDFWRNHAAQNSKMWNSILIDRPDMKKELQHLYHLLLMNEDPDTSLGLILATGHMSKDLYDALSNLQAHILLDAYSVLHEIQETEYGLARIEAILKQQ